MKCRHTSTVSVKHSNGQLKYYQQLIQEVRCFDAPCIHFIITLSEYLPAGLKYAYMSDSPNSLTLGFDYM